jgi:hypothetical protein
VDQGLDQHGGLHRHVQRAGDAGAGEGLRVAVLGAQGHEAGHLDLGQVDLAAAEVGEADVGNLVRRDRFLFGQRGTPRGWPSGMWRRECIGANVQIADRRIADAAR